MVIRNTHVAHPSSPAGYRKNSSDRDDGLEVLDKKLTIRSSYLQDLVERLDRAEEDVNISRQTVESLLETSSPPTEFERHLGHHGHHSSRSSYTDTQQHRSSKLSNQQIEKKWGKTLVGAPGVHDLSDVAAMSMVSGTSRSTTLEALVETAGNGHQRFITENRDDTQSFGSESGGALSGRVKSSFAFLEAGVDRDEPASYVIVRMFGGKLPLIILNPEARLKLVWIVPAFVFIMMEAFIMPFLLSFDVEPVPGEPLDIILRIVDLYFLCDIPIVFLTAYRDNVGTLVTKPKSIAAHYLRGWLPLDAAAAIPWSWLGSSTMFQAMTRSLKVLRLFRMFRLLRLVKMRQLLEVVEAWLEGDYTAELAFGFLKVLTLLCATTHWVACFWYSVGAAEDVSWISVESQDFAGDRAASIRDKYVWSLYFSLTTLTTVGYGDITPATTRECQFVLLILLTSAVVFSGLLGMLSELVACVNKEARTIGHKKRLLARYMKWRQVPSGLMMKVRKHLLFVWGMQKDYDLYEEDLKRSLTPTLKSELCYHVFKDVLRSAPFLAWLHNHPASEKFLATSVRAVFYDSTDFIFRAGDDHRDIFVLLGGAVTLYRKDSDADITDAPEDNALQALESWDLVKELSLAGRKRKQRSMYQRTSLMATELVEAIKIRTMATSEEADQEAEASFKGPCSSQVMNVAVQKLRQEDLSRRLAAVRIQRSYRRWKQIVRNVDFRNDGFEVHAPAYFGESCLWLPVHEWRSAHLQHTYTVRCVTRVEVVCIPRLAILSCIDRYSPWLRDRFENYREIVTSSMDDSLHGSYPKPKTGMANGDSRLSKESEPWAPAPSPEDGHVNGEDREEVVPESELKDTQLRI